MEGSRTMESPICFLGSTMANLPGRLHGLLQRHGQMLPRGAADEILLIERDLEEIISILSKLGEHRAMVARYWIKEVRELSYDMEDFIDLYEHGSTRSRTGSNPRRKIPKRCKSKAALSWHHNKLRQRLWMANKIREFSLRVQEALQRHGMYNLGDRAGTASATTCCYASNVASSHPTTFWEDDTHVGIGAVMKNVEDCLMSMHDGAEKLKVVSVIGSGGVGKTTLANELFRKLGWKFQCRAFVRTSQKLDARRLFISMLSQIRPHYSPDNWTVHGLISCIRTHMEGKRYLIIIDDLWSSSAWDLIKCALPDGYSGSKVVITTEIEDLALQSCGYDYNHIFQMKPLGEAHSTKLFFDSVFGPRHECPPELREVSSDIIRKCGGSPLAIVTIAGVLTSQLGMLEQWDYVNKSLGYNLMTDPTLEGIKHVLNLSYDSLPQHLKACMLYTSMYEEDSIIWKDDLVNQWIAEGFICAKDGQDKQEISGTWFNELIGRKLIQPVAIDYNGEVTSCVIHPMIRNLIVAHKSIEENFVTAVHHSETTTILADKVRRLSLHFGNAENAMSPTNMRLAQVRTLAFFGLLKCMPSIMEFRLLQVLILHFWGDADGISLDFARISELFRLRYLKVTSNVTLELQGKMRDLQCLETLDIDAIVSAAPSDIVDLQGLLHLKLPAAAKLPNGIDRMTSLRTLGCFDVNGNSLENVVSLRKLINLRELQLTCSAAQEPYYLKGKMEFLLDSIHAELRNLKSLTLVPTGSSCKNTLHDASDANKGIVISGSCVNIVLYSLQRFEFSPQICIFSCLPKCIRRLDKLCILKIGLSKVVTNDVEVLSGLPALTVLSLYVHTRPTETIVIGNTGFSVLKYFKFKCSDPRLKFEADAMPSLRKLKLGFDAYNSSPQTTMPIGIEHLLGLKEVIVEIGGACRLESQKATELAFRDAIRVHESCPRIIVQFVNKISGCKEDQSTVMRTKEKDLDSKIKHLEDEFTEYLQKVRITDNRVSFSDWHILHLLRNKLNNQHDDIIPTIPVVDAYSVDPWKLKEIGGEPCFFFRPLQEKGAWDGGTIQAPSGYWKATGSPEYIYVTERLSVGMKRTMEFFHTPAGIKTMWKMKEFSTILKPTDGAIAANQEPSEMSLCQLYTEPTTISAGSAGYNPTALTEEEHSASEQKDIRKHLPEIIETVEKIPEEVQRREDNMRSRRAGQKTVKISSYSLDDGYTWREHGQKDITSESSQNLRSYFRCTHWRSRGCMATKQVQRSDRDPLLYVIVYYGQHTCTSAACDAEEGPWDKMVVKDSNIVVA